MTKKITKLWELPCRQKILKSILRNSLLLPQTRVFVVFAFSHAHKPNEGRDRRLSSLSLISLSLSLRLPPAHRRTRKRRRRRKRVGDETEWVGAPHSIPNTRNPWEREREREIIHEATFRFVLLIPHPSRPAIHTCPPVHDVRRQFPNSALLLVQEDTFLSSVRSRSPECQRRPSFFC